MYNFRQFFIQINTQVAVFQHRYKSRKALSKLNSDQLRDIGLSKAQVNHEVHRPFWVGTSHGYRQFLLKRLHAENAFDHEPRSSALSHKQTLEA